MKKLQLLSNLKQSALSANKKILASFPLYPPVELFYAAGFTPVVLCGLKDSIDSLKESDRHLQSYACSVSRHLLQFLLGGAYKEIDGIFHYNTCDTLRNLPEIISEGLKEKMASLPFYAVHIPAGGLLHDCARKYFKEQISNLSDKLHEKGHNFSPVEFWESIELYNKIRNHYIEFEGHVRSGAMSYLTFTEIIDAGNFSLPETHLAELQKISVAFSGRDKSLSLPSPSPSLYPSSSSSSSPSPSPSSSSSLPLLPSSSSCSSSSPYSSPLSSSSQSSALSPYLPPTESKKRGELPGVIISGILPPAPEIIAIVEEAGLRIAGNDVATQRRSYGYICEPHAEPIEYYTNYYSNHRPCPTLLYTADRRIDELKNYVEKAEARGIIFAGEKFCEYEYLEYPYLEKLFKEKNIPTLTLEFSAEDSPGLGSLKTRIEAFAELLTQKP